MHAKGKMKYMDFATWLMAWDGYSIAAAALEQMTFAETQLHKRIVCEARCILSGWRVRWYCFYLFAR